MSRQLDAEVNDWAGRFVQSLVRATRDPATSLVLDVGAGQGKYARLLPEFTLEAIEVWEPYVDEWQLESFYRCVFKGVDVQTFVRLGLGEWYDVVIMGDVLEHLTSSDAEDVLDRLLTTTTSEVIVVVPYLYEQHEENGNPYQRHLQADLTPEVVARRYPQLELVALETRDFCPFKGVYRGRT